MRVRQKVDVQLVMVGNFWLKKTSKIDVQLVMVFYFFLIKTRLQEQGTVFYENVKKTLKNQRTARDGRTIKCHIQLLILDFHGIFEKIEKLDVQLVMVGYFLLNQQYHIQLLIVEF